MRTLLQKQKCSRNSGKSHSVWCQRASVGGQTQIIGPEDQSAQPGLWKKKVSELEDISVESIQSEEEGQRNLKK